MTLKQIIVEIHRRSLWQVLTIYLGASWAVMEATDQIVDRYLLPEWVYPAALILLLIGLPVVLATAFVREESQPAQAAESTAATGDPATAHTAPSVEAHAVADAPAVGPGRASRTPLRLLTWPRAILGGVLAFAALAGISAFIVLKGTPRVTQAYGAAGEAFEERQWIVLADFATAEEDAEVALAAQALLTVDLQQSKYVNVYTRAQIAPVLERMRLSDTLTVDEALALEIAEREGLAAVLAPALNRLGRDYVFSARVILPGTREEIISASALAREDRLPDGIEKLSREIRGRLGEERAAVQESQPLPRVTTRSLPALKKLAQAGIANSRDRDYARALRLAEEAIRLDSGFAAAYRAAAIYNRNLGRWAEAVPYATRAYELRDRLTERERLHVEAVYASAVELNSARAAEIYEHLLSLYPDDRTAAINLAGRVGTLRQRERAYQASLKALELAPYSSFSYSLVIRNARWTDRWEVADSVIRLARERGFEDDAARWERSQAAGLGDWDRVDALCDSLLALDSRPARQSEDRTICGQLDFARGRLRRGIERKRASARYCLSQAIHLCYGGALAFAALAERIRGRPQAARAALEAILTRIPPDSLAEPDRFLFRTFLQATAALAGLPDLATRVEAAYPPYPDSAHRISLAGEALAAAARALAQGEAERALEQLRAVEAIDRPQLWANMLFGRAFDELGQTDSAIAYLEEVIRPSRIASDGSRLSRIYLPLIERRLAELEESRGNVEAAIDHYQRFLELWSDPDPELHDQVRSAQRALARLTGAETS